MPDKDKAGAKAYRQVKVTTTKKIELSSADLIEAIDMFVKHKVRVADIADSAICRVLCRFNELGDLDVEGATIEYETSSDESYV